MVGVGSYMMLQCLALLLLSWNVLAKKPNILFILTDDQDWHYNSLVSKRTASGLDYMLKDH